MTICLGDACQPGIGTCTAYKSLTVPFEFHGHLALSPMSLFTDNLAPIVAISVTILVARMFWQYRRVLNSVGGTPGPRSFFSPATLFTRLLPEIPNINHKLDWIWKQKFRSMYRSHCSPKYLCLMPPAFELYGQDIIAAITMYPSPKAFIQLSDPKAIKVSANDHCKAVR